ncbi:hypothetical protein KCP69_13150 [Salmonella enterica subsp. enterica]|nr:hypothetical protein KCP69_13150 [Salmonella enterica subsp. enterica]
MAKRCQYRYYAAADPAECFCRVVGSDIFSAPELFAYVSRHYGVFAQVIRPGSPSQRLRVALPKRLTAKESGLCSSLCGVEINQLNWRVNFVDTL